MNEQNNIQEVTSVDMDGLMRLVTGIIKRAKEDYIRGKYVYRKDVERFMKSEYYHVLTDLNNGGIALAYWEEKRREELGEGDISYPDVKIFLIEGLVTKCNNYNKIKRQQAIVLAADVKTANEIMFQHGMNTSNKDYVVIELKGLNKKCNDKLHKSKKGFIVVKDESV